MERGRYKRVLKEDNQQQQQMKMTIYIQDIDDTQ